MAAVRQAPGRSTSSPWNCSGPGIVKGVEENMGYKRAPGLTSGGPHAFSVILRLLAGHLFGFIEIAERALIDPDGCRTDRARKIPCGYVRTA